jgi:hypothetical protein
VAGVRAKKELAMFRFSVIVNYNSMLRAGIWAPSRRKS